MIPVVVVVGCLGVTDFSATTSWGPSVGPVLNPYPHNGVCVCVYRHKAEVSAYACAFACVVSSLCPVYFSLPATLRLPSTTLAIPSQSTHIGWGVSRPVKSRSYRHSGHTDSTPRCCYECYQRSQFTEDNAEPSFLPGINSLWWYLIVAYFFWLPCRNENRGAKGVGHGSGEGVPYPQDRWDLGRGLRPSQDSLWTFQFWY